MLIDPDYGSTGMPHVGQELEGPGGQRLRFVQLTDELIEMEQRYSGEGAMPPPHLHPRQDERFTVLEGAVDTVIAGVERRFTAGQTFEVPAGTVHQMGGIGSARVRWEIRPALRSAQFFEDLYGGVAAQEGPAFLARYADEFRLAAP